MKKEPEILDFFGIPIGHFPDRSTRWLFQNKEFVQDLLEILASELVEWNVLISIVSHRLTGVLFLTRFESKSLTWCLACLSRLNQEQVNNPALKHGACAKRMPSVHSTS